MGVPKSGKKTRVLQRSAYYRGAYYRGSTVTRKHNSKYCFLCKREVNSKFKRLKFGEKFKICCYNCNSSEHKVLKTKYTGIHADAQCSVCSKVVRGNTCIHCTMCNHFVHPSCNNLSSGDIKKIEKSNPFWTCLTCTSLIFPFSNVFSGNKDQPTNCKSCHTQIKSENSKSDNCLKCNESLECPMCTKIVNYESILCDLCEHWVHASCISLTAVELELLGNQQKPWFCYTCCTDIFPFYNSTENDIDQTQTLPTTTNTFKTYTDCSICHKKVTSNKSLCCSICRHWIHKKCTGEFRTGEYNKFLSFYSNKEWVCHTCNEDIFPFSNLDSIDIQLMSLTCSTEYLKLSTKELTNVCKQLLNNSLLDKTIFYNNNDIDNDTVNNSSEINFDTIFPFIDNCHYKYNLQEISLINNPSNNITVLNFNIRSIQSNFNKFTSNILTSKTFQPDIIILTETWLNKDSNIDDYHIKGYNPPIVQNRTNGRGGGVMVYIDSNISNFKHRFDLSFSDNYNNCLTIEANISNTKFLITGVYRSPSDNNTTFQSAFDNIVTQINNQHCNSILAGDFNYNLFNVNHHSDTEQYYNNLISFGYHPQITKATRITDNSCTLIDHIWTNYNTDAEENSSSTYIIISDITDHLPTLFIDKKHKHKSGYTFINYRNIDDTTINNFLLIYQITKILYPKSVKTHN